MKMGLVDYAGSDSECDEKEEIQQEKSKAADERKTKNEEVFFEDSEEIGSPINLGQHSEDVLEEIVKPKNWEKKLAEKEKKKLEKKALKKARKLEKKNKKKIAKISTKDKIQKVTDKIEKSKTDKAKVVIHAYGALSGIANGNESEDSDDEETTPAPTKQKIGHVLLSNLPAPKGRDNRSDGSNLFDRSMVPRSVAKVNSSASLDFKPVSVPKIVEESDDDDEPTDFFGFMSAPSQKKEASPEIPLMGMNSSMDVVGPSRPTIEDETDPRHMYEMPEDEISGEGPSASDKWLHRTISDEQAHKLLMRFSHDIGPEERRSINEMANSIVDVKVDDALGPDVKTNIIKNIGHRAFIEGTSAPLPQVQTQGQTSRRKHQITYLASLAVAREEQLKDQWAEQKQSKRMARQKYGF